MSYATLLNSRNVPQTEALNERQIANHGGGYFFAVDIWTRLDRFLILGTDEGTYYQQDRDVTREAAKVVEQCWKEDHVRTAARVAEISDAGRAPKNSPAILAVVLGTLAEDVRARQSAFAIISKVCRTASHLFEFASLCDALRRGFGRGVSREIRNWYETMETGKLGFQMSKYRARLDYSHKRLLQRVRPSAADGDAQRVALYRWGVGNDMEGHVLPEIVEGHIAAMAATTVEELVPLIVRHRLSREAVPTWALTDRRVWEALLPNLGMEALVKNLSALTDVGVLGPLSPGNALVVDRIVDAGRIKASRLHPLKILLALAVYRSGRSVRGERTWKPVQVVLDALDAAFYLSFGNVESTGKAHMLGIDVSGSMAQKMISGGVISCREVSAAMALVTARTEPNYAMFGFDKKIVDLDITSRDTLGDAMRKVSRMSFGDTDCAALMLHAVAQNIRPEVFAVFTDNETNQNSMHPSEALRLYRRKTGIPAKLVVSAMAYSGGSIADPQDGGMLDLVGFDAGSVAVMADFVRS